MREAQENFRDLVFGLLRDPREREKYVQVRLRRNEPGLRREGQAVGRPEPCQVRAGPAILEPRLCLQKRTGSVPCVSSQNVWLEPLENGFC